MSTSRQLMLCLFALVACLLTACQGGRDMKYYNFPDAVTNINQVDPAYRKYFADQQGRNYSADDQRKALAAAIRTSRTPVPAAVPRSAMASARKSVRRGRSSARSGRYAVAKRKAVRGRRVVAKRRSAVAKAKAKRVTKRRAVAKRRASSRRRG